MVWASWGKSWGGGNGSGTGETVIVDSYSVALSQNDMKLIVGDDECFRVELSKNDMSCEVVEDYLIEITTESFETTISSSNIEVFI